MNVLRAASPKAWSSILARLSSFRTPSLRTPGSAPPGFITANVYKGRQGFRQRMPVGRGYQDARPEGRPQANGSNGSDGNGRMLSGNGGRGGAEPLPAHGDYGRGGLRWTSPRDATSEPGPRMQPREETPRDASQGQKQARDSGRRSEPAPADRSRDSGGNGGGKRGAKGSFRKYAIHRW